MDDDQRRILLALQHIIDTSSSSSSESDGDDLFDDDDLELDEALENHEQFHRHQIPRVENFIETVINRYTEEEFRQTFRVRRETFEYILLLIRPELEADEHHIGRHPIPVDEQLYMALWVLGTPDSYRSVTTKFGRGLATVWRAVQRVVRALCNLKDVFIRWPTEEEAVETSNRLQATYGFPGVLGAVDGTHIRICAPKRDRQSYVNRKGFHSIQLQVVCNDKLEFVHCYAGLPGSVHDMRVFSHSGLQQRCNDDNFPNNFHLIGDSAYTLQRHVIVPFRDNGHLTVEQEHFNYVLSSTRIIVERAIGLLKRRWRYLIEKLPMTNTGLISYYVLSCCILHNICLMMNDDFEYPILLLENENQVAEPVDVPNLRQQQGANERDQILEQLNMDVN